MSKESTLSDAIDLIRKLQNQVLELQRQLADPPGEAWEKQGSASCSESFTATENMPYQVIASCCHKLIPQACIVLENIKHQDRFLCIFGTGTQGYCRHISEFTWSG